ncbi:MAG: Si-specific NAD(P)(+) transhydrogenase [Bdellovibrionales bacterium]|jgi:NAD(P) transhydrogenase|nr:Si-specific NAD(P)(+) transhydrogenase [Bdellovibrionales bacterium]
MSAEFDLIVIGSGPGGQKAAVQASKLGKRVLVVEKDLLGGSCLQLGTIPSKALRESALMAKPGELSLLGVMERTRRIIKEERHIIEDSLERNGIETIQGVGSLLDSKTVIVEHEGAVTRFTAPKILIATGTRPRRPREFDFDGFTIFDSDTVLEMKFQPRTLLVVGAGVIGVEYASIFARTGVRVTLQDTRPDMLKAIDQEVVMALTKQLTKSGVKLRLGWKLDSVKTVPGETGRAWRADATFSRDDETITEKFDAVLVCQGRTGNFEQLKLDKAGLAPDERGTLRVNRDYQTSVPNIYAVGDIIGAPALAASSAEQGRLAALHAFSGAAAHFPETFPYGIYTIPEISTVGMQEEEVKAKGIHYVVGKAAYSELARGKMIEDEFGFLKLLVHVGTKRIIGVHVIGTGATELVHIGQVAMSFGATVDFFVENVFNYPTLAEAYKVAAYNARNQL